MTATRTGEVTAYLAGVRYALADLPDGDRDELLADLPEHLHEIAAELEPNTGLVDRLGPPEAYAAELRAAAGLSEPVAAAEPAPRWAVLAERLDRDLGRALKYDRYSDFIVELRPAWWVLRGFVIAVAVVWMWFGSLIAIRPPLSMLIVFAAVAAVISGLSVRLGRVSVEGRRWLGVLANAATFVALIPLWAEMISAAGDGELSDNIGRLFFY